MAELLEQRKQSKGNKLKLHEIPDVIKKEDLSAETLDVILHFGMDAPSLLNKYCCALEDALIEQIHNYTDARKDLYTLAGEVARLRRLLAIKQPEAEAGLKNP